MPDNATDDRDFLKARFSQFPNSRQMTPPPLPEERRVIETAAPVQFHLRKLFNE